MPLLLLTKAPHGLLTDPCTASEAWSRAQPSFNDAPGPPTSPSSNSSPSANRGPRAVSLLFGGGVIE